MGYGQVVVWSALSYALRGAPDGVPRRVDIPDTWHDTGPWSVARVSHPDDNALPIGPCTLRIILSTDLILMVLALEQCPLGRLLMPVCMTPVA